MFRRLWRWISVIVVLALIALGVVTCQYLSTGETTWTE